MAKAYKRAALPACPFSGSDVAIRLMNASQTAQQEAERKLRDGVGIGIGAARVSNRNTASGGHLQVNVIRADAVDHDSSQTGGLKVQYVYFGVNIFLLLLSIKILG